MAETTGIPLAGQPEHQPASATNERESKPAQGIADVPASSTGAEGMASKPETTLPAKTSASRGRKRKADEDDSTAGASPKKTKRKTTASTPKPRQTKRTKKTVEAPPPATTPTPTELTAPVQAKIDSIKRFLRTEMAHEDSMLLREDPENYNLVSIPELDLLGVIMTLYFHYQLGSAETEASISDIKDAIIERFKKPMDTYGDVDWVTLNLATTTKLEQRIKEKVTNHELEDVRLLELEMEIFVRKNRARVGAYEWEAERVLKAADELNKVVERGWEGMYRRIEAGLMKGDVGREKGRKGACPKPAVEVV